MLQQSIAEARTARALAESRLTEIQALKNVVAADKEIEDRLRLIIKDSDELIARKQKQLDDLKCTKFSFLFGLLSVKKCG